MHIRFNDDDNEAEAAEAPSSSSLPQAEAHPSGPCSPPARLAVVRSVRADFDSKSECYIYDVVQGPEAPGGGTTLAASLSNRHLKVYTAHNSELVPVGDLTGHTANINGIAFCQGAHILHSCSTDASVCGWDTRSGQQIERVQAPGRALWSLSVHDNVIAAGANSEVLFWDRRTQKVLQTFQDAHAEEVTQVKFHPGSPNAFFSASTDGLISVYDLSVGLNEDDAFKACLNTGNSVAELGFYGPGGSRMWFRTHTEGLHLWDWMAACSEEGAEGTEALLAMENFREAAGQAAAAAGIAELAGQVDYVIGCSYDESTDSLSVKAGNNQGSAAIFPVASAGGSTMGVRPPSAVLCGGHTSVVRCLLWPGTGTRCLTAGEDAHLSIWDVPSAVPQRLPGAAHNQHVAQRNSRGAGRRHSPY